MKKSLAPRRRILIHFLLGIALPSVLLGYLAFRGIRNDQALLERERRQELVRAASAVSATIEARLAQLEVAFDSTPPGTRPGRRGGGLVEATFSIDSDGVLAITGGAPFADVPAPPAPRRQGWAAWDSARAAELRGGDAGVALSRYRRLLDSAPDSAYRAEVLAGIARTARKASRHDESAGAWRRLAREHARTVGAAGMPMGPVGELEFSATLLETGDSLAAVRSLAALYARLLEPEWPLTRAQFEFLAARARETAAAASAGPALRPWRDSLAALAGAERRVLERDDELARFRDLAGGLAAMAPKTERRLVLQGAGRDYHVLLGAARAEDGGARHGLLLDPDAVRAELVVPVLEAAARSGGFDWTIRGRTGSVLAGRADPAGEAAAAPALVVPLPGALGTWTLELHQPAPGLAATLLTWRHGVYFYSFLLLAGILVFGLTLTIRSVNHELRLARMQADFVSTVSHEFKSPLTAIRQLTEMLRADRVPSEERRRRYYDVLLEQSERLSMLIDNVLDFARMEEGRRDLSLERVAPSVLVKEAAAAARQRLEHEGFRIETRVADGLPAVAVDRTAIGQALGNLLDNAARYSGEARDVVVSASREDGHVVLAVRDSGIGLRPEDSARVFDRFFRAGDPLTRTVKGTGLGLTLVKQIAEAHGGSVGVESAPGEGSTFRLRLPAAAPTSESAPGAFGPVHHGANGEEPWSAS